MAEMTKQEQAFQYAARMANIKLTDERAKLLYRLAVIAGEKIGDVSIMDIAKIQHEVHEEINKTK